MIARLLLLLLLPLLLLPLLPACGGGPDHTPAAGGVDTLGSTETADTALPPQPYSSAEACGACHPTHYAEWQQSMHAYAARSPVFDAMAAKAYRDSAGTVGTFCTGCHSPFGTAEGEGGATVAADRSELSREGVSCDFCHTAVAHTGQIGNTSVETDRTSGIRYGPYDDAMSQEHGTERGDFLTSPEFCGSCHDVFMYPGLQIEQAYTEYLESPAAEAGTRCQDCHMSPEPGAVADKVVEPIAVVDGETYPDRERSSHRFVGPDSSLLDDFPYEDDLAASAEAQAEYLTQVQTLLENSVHIADAVFVDQDGTLELEVVLESLVDGHRVPTGFTSERQLWLAVTATDADGVVLSESGDLDEDGNLRDSHSHQVLRGEVALDEALVNLQSTNSARAKQFGENGVGEDGDDVDDVVVHDAIFPFDATTIIRHSLEPREQRTVTYTLDPQTTHVAVALRYRAMPPYVLQALALEELMERVPIFTIDETELEAE